MPILWSEDDFTLIKTPATGRVAMVFPGGPTVELGDTGERDITGDLIAGTVASGRLLTFRSGSMSGVRFEQLKLVAGDGTGNTQIRGGSSSGSAIYGFRPVYSEWKSLKVNSAGHAVRINVGNTMGVQVQFALAGVEITGTVMWHTVAAWPTSLPGVADGGGI